MNRLTRRLAVLGPVLLAGTLYQGCTVLVPVPGYAQVNLPGSFPHFDGDGEGSFFDRLFGFDDDDRDDDDWRRDDD
ncbi:hypothetical protein RAS1_37950 [Phycisphaerae bacterium RAS1]|nr:hypothetical protein RAS1_37950 [Phycisphaerae bacterium RAS1]